MKVPCVKVSVIMPVYNSAVSIEPAIRSVMAQKGVTFELLIGDDGSTDDSWKKISAHLNKSYVRAFRFKKNQGVSKISNYLITQASGKYISTCDADDRMLSGNLCTFANILDRNPEVGVAYGDLTVSASHGATLIKRRFMPKKSWDLLGGCFANGGAMIRRSLFKKVGGYRPDILFLEDCDLFLRLAEVSKLYYFPGRPLYCQKKRSGSLSDKHPKRLKKVSQDLLRSAIRRRYGYQVSW